MRRSKVCERSRCPQRRMQSANRDRGRTASSRWTMRAGRTSETYRAPRPSCLTRGRTASLRHQPLHSRRTRATECRLPVSLFRLKYPTILCRGSLFPKSPKLRPPCRRPLVPWLRHHLPHGQRPCHRLRQPSRDRHQYLAHALLQHHPPHPLHHTTLLPNLRRSYNQLHLRPPQ